MASSRPCRRSVRGGSRPAGRWRRVDRAGDAARGRRRDLGGHPFPGTRRDPPRRRDRAGHLRGGSRPVVPHPIPRACARSSTWATPRTRSTCGTGRSSRCGRTPWDRSRRSARRDRGGHHRARLDHQGPRRGPVPVHAVAPAVVADFRFAVVGMLVLAIWGAPSSSGPDSARRRGASSPERRGPHGVWEEEVQASSTPRSRRDPRTAAATSAGAPGYAGAGQAQAGPVTSAAPSRGHSCLGAAAIVRGFDVCPQDPAAMRPDPVAARRTRPTPIATAAGCTHRSHRNHVPLREGRVRSPSSATRTPATGYRRSRSSPSGTAGRSRPTSPPSATRPTRRSSYTGGPGCPLRRVGDGGDGGEAFDLVVTSQRQSVATRATRWSETAAAKAGYTSYLKRWSRAGTTSSSCRTRRSPGAWDDPGLPRLAPRQASRLRGTPDMALDGPAVRRRRQVPCRDLDVESHASSAPRRCARRSSARWSSTSTLAHDRDLRAVDRAVPEEEILAALASKRSR